MSRVCFSAGPTGNGLVHVLCCNLVKSSRAWSFVDESSMLWCYQSVDLLAMTLTAHFSILLLGMVSREWCRSLPIQAVLLTLCFAVVPIVYTHSHNAVTLISIFLLKFLTTVVFKIKNGKKILKE